MKTTCRTLRNCAAALALITMSTSAGHALDSSILLMFGGKLSEQMCSDGGKWLRCYRISPSSCSAVTESLVKPCIEESFSGISEQMEYSQGLEVAQKLQKCINTRFEKTYGSRKLDTPECANSPEHLQDKKE